MRVRRHALGALCAVLVALALPAAALADGITNSGGDGRTGWYPDAASLTPQLVSGGRFGRLWSAGVAGAVYAQPLLAGNTLVVATEGDHVYGLDPATGAQRWDAALGTPFKASDLPCGDLAPDIGITSTPVVDMSTRTIYAVAKSYVGGTSGPVQWQMHALDLDTGAERAGFPVTISGTADNAPAQAFNARTQLQRPGLLLLDGVVYVAFGSHCDISPWQGWVFGISTAGRITARWVAVASGNGAGIWQSGSGLASDGPGRIEFGTGNGGAPPLGTPGSTPPSKLGESVVRLQVQPDGSLQAADFFAPSDAANLDSWDADFASGGLVNLPDAYFGTSAFPHLAVAVGKEGYVYLMDRDHLGGIGMGPSGSDDVVGRFGPFGGVWSRPGIWPGDGGWVYIPTASGGNSAGGSSGYLNFYSYGVSGAGKPILTRQAVSGDAFGFSSSAPVVTSDGTRSGSALVWVVWTPNASGVGAQLRAYDPLPVNGRPVLRWSAPLNAPSSKFAMPGVGAGRVYVGTRDGHVLGFGSPVSPPVTGSSLEFPTTTVGTSSTRTMTLTATGDVTVSDVVSDSAAFSADKSGLTLPATLHAGDSLSFPVTFRPTAAKLYGGTLTVKSNTGDTPFGMTGNGLAAGPQLAVSPPAVSFGGASVGGHLSGSVTFRNLGGSTLHINAVDLPRAPFSSPDAPRAGDTIPPEGSLTVTVDFDPRSAGSFVDEIGLETDGGTESAGLSGSGGTPGRLAIHEEETALGPVPVGTSKTVTFTVTNTGQSPVTITRSKPPSGGDIAASTTLAEGTTLAGGQTVTESVTFAPTGAGFQDASWSLNGNDSTGVHDIHFTGTGAVPAPGSAWRLGGGAALAGGTLWFGGGGSAFYGRPVSSDGLRVTFDANVAAGTGGLALAFADASALLPPAPVSTTGPAFEGLTGVGAALDLESAPPFAGFTDGAGHWLAQQAPLGGLAAGTHAVRVESHRGTLTMWVDGAQVLSRGVALPSRVWLGFTGSGAHTVSNVAVAGAESPPASTLAITRVVDAPAGTPEAGFTPAVAGKCPSAVSLTGLAPGQTASPALVNGYAGRSCTLSEDAANEDGWTYGVSVNGGPETPLTPAGGRIAVPAFTLAAGENKVVFHDRWAPPPVRDVTDAGWQLNGDASRGGAAVQLTTTATGSRGSAFWPTAVDPRGVTVEFDATIGGGTGADGMALVFADAGRRATPTALGQAGAALGFGGIPGIAVALDTYRNPGDPSNNFVGISDGSGATPGSLHWLATAAAPTALRGSTHRVKVTAAGGTLTVWIDGTQVLRATVALPSAALVGFSGASGGKTDRHAVSNVEVSGQRFLARASLAIRTQVAAPVGSSEAGARVSYQGSCPSDFEAVGQADGAVARPGLDGAVAGQRCQVGVILPSTGTWSVSASVAGGPATVLRVQDGIAFVPDFGLSSDETPLAITITLTSPATFPPLASSPRSLSFSATAGAAPPAAKTLTVYAGTARIPIAIASSSPWLRVTPATGTTTLRAGVSVDPAGLPPGTYRARLRVTSRSEPAALAVPVTLVVNAPAAPAPASAAPVAAWGFDERRGNVVRDVTGHGHDGVIHGAVRVAGRYGGGLSFNGAGDWVTVPDSRALRPRHALTLEAWVRPSSRRSGWGTAIVKQRGSALAYGLYAPGRRGRPAADIAARGDHALSARTRLRTRAWTHLAATWDGRTLRLYVNAALVAARGVRGPLARGGGPLRFGGNAIWSEFYRGTLDEVRIYDRALTAAQLRADRRRPVLAGTPAHPTRRRVVGRATRHGRAPKPLRRVHRTV